MTASWIVLELGGPDGCDDGGERTSSGRKGVFGGLSGSDWESDSLSDSIVTRTLDTLSPSLSEACFAAVFPLVGGRPIALPAPSSRLRRVSSPESRRRTGPEGASLHWLEGFVSSVFFTGEFALLGASALLLSFCGDVACTAGGSCVGRSAGRVNLLLFRAADAGFNAGLR